jgi:MFS family permease
MLPWTATLFIVAPVAGNLAGKIGERPLIVTGLLLQSLGIGWLALIAQPDMHFIQTVAPLIVAGCGVSMAMPATQSVVLGAVARGEIGKASGVLNMLRFLGGVFGVAVLGAAFAVAGSLASPRSFASGFTVAMTGCAMLSLFGAIAGLALPGRHHVVTAQRPVGP